MIDTAALRQIWAAVSAAVPRCDVLIELDGARLLERDPRARSVAIHYSGASMIKTFLALMITQDVAAGARSWDDEIEVRTADLSPGDGVLNTWRLPAVLGLGNLQQLMIGLSDNTATNTITDLLGGVAAVNDRIVAYGFDSRLRRHCGRTAEPAIDEVPDPDLPSRPGFSLVVPDEHLAALQRACALDPLTRQHFESQADRRCLARFLDEDVPFAHKTGTSEGVRHDAGFLDHDGHRLAVSWFTDSALSAESVDHPGCRAGAQGMARTLELLGWDALLAGDYWPRPSVA